MAEKKQNVTFSSCWLFVDGIRESVDSLCRDGVDAPNTDAILKEKPYNFFTNTLKAYLSA